MSSGAGKTVCATGANGYIASWVVKYLLDRGYTVNATVRDLSDPTKTAHLVGLDGAAERLHLFTANLLEEGSFDAAIKGCEGVFHVASPFFYQETPDPKADLFDPAEKGTLNVLNSVVKASTVKRVVLTSSIATVAFNEKPLTLDTLVDETWYASRALHTEKKQWYDLSKILAEDAAVAFAKEKGLDLVILNPALVIGPLLQPTLNTSAEVILNLINGTQTTYPNAAYGYVNVKDVAHAHVQAFEIPSASGRYLLVESVVPFKNVVQLLHDFYPTLKQLPDKPADDKPFVHGFKVSKEKAKTLGIEFTPFEQSLKETVESLKENKFISF